MGMNFVTLSMRPFSAAASRVFVGFQCMRFPFARRVRHQVQAGVERPAVLFIQLFQYGESSSAEACLPASAVLAEQQPICAALAMAPAEISSTETGQVAGRIEIGITIGMRVVESRFEARYS